MNLLTIIATFNVIIYTVLVVLYHKKHKARKEVTPAHGVNKPIWKPCGYYTAKYDRIKQHNDSIVKGACND